MLSSNDQRWLLCACGLVLMGAIAAAAETSAEAKSDKVADKVVTVNGAHVTVQLPETDMALLADREAFVRFLDEVYSQMRELTAASPPVVIRSADIPPGVWGWANADGVEISRGAVADVMKDFNRGLVSFGLIHEIGHVFDARDKPRWYITPHSGGEEAANLKLSFAVDRLLRPDNRYRIDFGPGGPQTGWNFNNNGFLRAGDKYLADPSIDWTAMDSDTLHAFHLGIARQYGWDVLKKWFRTYPVMEEMGFWAPPETNDPQRMVVQCAILSHYARADLMPYFRRWRLPVTAEAMAAAVKQYRLKEAFAQVERQFSQEVRTGQIKRDGVKRP